MYYEIKDMRHLKDLKECDFNDKYTIRNFLIQTKDQVKYLIKNYKDKFAFGILYNGNEYSLFKEDSFFYIRNNKNHKFEFPNCPPPVTSVYCLKSENIEEVMDFV